MFRRGSGRAPWVLGAGLLIVMLLVTAAPPGGVSFGQGDPTPNPRDRCGDGTCEGPETATLCPQDCLPPEGAPPACAEPNPRRAQVSQDLEEFHNFLEYGDFEQGMPEIELDAFMADHLTTGTRSANAARTGSYGYAVTAGDASGALGLPARFEKGQTVRFTLWLRSLGQPTRVRSQMLWLDGFGDIAAQDPLENTIIETTWTEISLVIPTSQRVNHAMLVVAIPANAALYVDDLAVERPVWRMATYEGPTVTVGGIPVPPEPVAPVHFALLIHIEDPMGLTQIPEYFHYQSAVLRELARILHEHGGFLTIQPEEDWVLGAVESGYAPDLLAELATEYGVQYSTHAHGPSCRDPDGRLRSNTDCQENRDTPGWDFQVLGHGYPDVVDYVRNLRDLIQSAAGVPVTDHNGNFDFAEAGRLSEVPMLTWSAYKNAGTQRTYDWLINNPWRPGPVNANENIDAWLTHHPGTDIVYIPGWGQTLTPFHDELLFKLRPVVSQQIYYADPERVNTFYIITHVGFFRSWEQYFDYVAYDPATGGVTYSDEFLQHLAYYDAMLTEVIDPLVAAGYLQWTSLPDMGQLYLQWEAACGLGT